MPHLCLIILLILNTACNASDKYTLEKIVSRQLQINLRLEDNVAGQHYLNKLASNLSNYNATMLLSYGSEINAFATFGDLIVIQAGLLEALDSEEELLGVIAHEKSHLKLDHLGRMLQRQQARQPLNILAIAAAALSPNPGAVLYANMAWQVDSYLHFSRWCEIEADRSAVSLLQKSGYSGDAMVKALMKLKSKQVVISKTPEYFRTHPLFSNRIVITESLAKNKNLSVRSILGIDFEFLKARIKAKWSDMSYDDITKMDISSSKQAFYAASLYYNKKCYAESLKILNTLKKQFPANIFILDLLKEIYNSQGNYKLGLSMALKQFEATKSLAFAWKLAHQYLLMKQPNLAYSTLVRNLNKVPTPYLASYYDLLAETANARKNLVAMHYYRAQYWTWLGDWTLAEKQIRLGLNKNPNAYWEQLLKNTAQELKNLKKELKT